MNAVERPAALAIPHHALRRFVEEVAWRHPGRPPLLYGNCQGGWVVVALLSADCHGLIGAAWLKWGHSMRLSRYAFPGCRVHPCPPPGAG